MTENGFGKRTDVDEYRLTARGAQGVNNLKATPKVGKTASILLVDETSELMVISQWGKIIRIDTKTVRAAGRATQGVRLLNLEADDKVAAAVIIPPEEMNGRRRSGHTDPVINPPMLREPRRGARHAPLFIMSPCRFKSRECGSVPVRHTAVFIHPN